MNLYFARACIAVCGISLPFLMVGKMGALGPFLLGLIGILYYASITRNANVDRE